MEGLADAEEQRGKEKDFKAREREKKERMGISDGREMAGYRNGREWVSGSGKGDPAREDEPEKRQKFRKR